MSDGHRGVWIFAEQQGERLSRRVPELLGCGRRLADELEVELAAALLGDGLEPLAQELVWCGADKVYLINSPLLNQYHTAPYSSALKGLLLKYRPEALLFPSTPLGKDLAPRVACALKLGLTAHCVELRVDKVTREVEQICPFFDFMAVNRSATKPMMIMVLPGIARPLPRDEARKGEVVRASLPILPPDVELISTEKLEKEEGSKLEEAERVVGVGRGVKDFHLIEQLATELGAALGGTQFGVDEGMVSEAQLIGVTGVTVRPKLYIACGISGASQHTLGMERSEVVVAINQDRDAPIFKVADYGIVGDVQTIVPLLTQCLKNRVGHEGI